ncbi:MAG TPA: crotonase/enoyl-CoA hydratase family protein [Streptosporangiaceae bacterium]|nr:crotonase/enoyl-CoA hydratase family protein [Streptosporangiaceae bacterium]
MGQRVRYAVDGAIATITMDDGKVNALSSAMLGDINAALDRAQADADVIVLGGRPGVFSAGFDLPVLREGGDAAGSMLRAGFDLAERLLSFPAPVVIACSGHAIAMGAFLVLSGDFRVGAAGPYKITANEVAIGLTLPRAAVEICRQRLSPAHFNRATITAEVYAPAQAVEAGFLDQVVDAAELDQAVRSAASQLAQLDLAAHSATKLRARKATLHAVHEAIGLDSADYAATLAG